MTAPVPNPAALDRTAGVEAAVERLDRVADLPAKEQINVYAQAHRVLSETLNTIDER